MIKTKVLTLVLAISCSVICFSQQLKIDHVIAVVSDLEASIQNYTDKGFTVKKGRVHNNGLLNAHIKFQNGTSYELMTIKDTPKDEIAKAYAQLLSEKEGGVYIALSGMSTEDMAAQLDLINIDFKLIEGNNWNYIVFEGTALSHFFFIDYKVKSSEAENITSHKNKSTRIKEVSTTGSALTFDFLDAFFDKHSPVENNANGKGIKYKSTTGGILVFKNDSIDRHRLLSMEFGAKSPNNKLIITY